MADQTNQQQQQGGTQDQQQQGQQSGSGGQQGQQQQSAGGTGQQQSQGGQQQPGPVPYERFKEVNEQLKALQTQLAQLQEGEKKRKEKEAADQGQWQKLAEQKDAELKVEKLARLRLEVATKKGIPADLAGRLQGDTAEAMEKDADAMLQFVKPKEGPGVPPAGKGGSATPLDLSKMSAEEVRKAMKGKTIADVA